MKAVWTGNPIRKNFKPRTLPAGESRSRPENFELNYKFKFNNILPIVLFLGGGTGAMAINTLVWEALSKLTEFSNVIHLTGKGKSPEPELLNSLGAEKRMNYKCFEFLDSAEMSYAYQAAAVVVSRCGMGVLTELSYLAKPAILIPIPRSHQVYNANIYNDAQAAIVLNQNKLDGKILIKNIKMILSDRDLQLKLSENMKKISKPGANENVLEVINNILEAYARK
jgi:UDP-N-acetylglucosamine:LPS N-acetylglucosamine transferase